MYFGEGKTKSVLFTAKRITKLKEKKIEERQRNCVTYVEYILDETLTMAYRVIDKISSRTTFSYSRNF